MGFLEEQISRNVANQIYIAKAMGKGVSDEQCLDVIEKAVGRGAPLGEVRTWNGKEYIKTPKGWRPKPKGYKEGEKERNGIKDNPVMKPEKANSKSVTDKLKVGDHVMYNGKEMILTRISKDGRFQNGIEMKFANEGETTPTGSKTKVGNIMYATPVDNNGHENKFKFSDKGNGKFELDIPGKGGAQILAGDGTFEVKVWNKDFKYLTNDSKRHEFDSKAEAEKFARDLINAQGESKNPLAGGEKELSFISDEGEKLNVRVYKDGGVKVEGANIRKDFDNTDKAWDFLSKRGFSQKK